MTITHTIGFIICITFIMVLSLISGKKVKTNVDYISGSSNIGLLIVTGYVFNTNLGGASTIGATQGAFIGGLYGSWWNCGLCIGGFLIGCLFVRPVKNSKCVTMQQFIKSRYGNNVALLSAGITSLGVILSIITQQLAAIALIMTLFDLPIYLSGLISALMMIGYIILGGTIGAGTVGVIKIILLVSFSVLGGIISLSKLLSNPTDLSAILPQSQYFNIHYGGLINNIGNLISAVIGLSVSQLVFTACSMAKNEATAHKAFYISSLLIIPVSISTILMGMYVKVLEPTITSSHAMPYFFLTHFHPLFSGIALATLLITVVGTGASVTLGVATVISNDLIGHFFPERSDKKKLFTTRLIIVLIVFITYFVSCLNENAYVPVFTMISMALRSSINCAPVWLLCLFKRYTQDKYCIFAMISGLLIYILVGVLFKTTMYSIVLSISISMMIILVTGKRAKDNPSIAKI